MIPRRLIAGLLLPVPVLVVTFAVLLGASALARATSDGPAANVLFWLAITAVLLLIIDLLLLVMALAIRAVEEDRDDEDRSP